MERESYAAFVGVDEMSRDEVFDFVNWLHKRGADRARELSDLASDLYMSDWRINPIDEWIMHDRCFDLGVICDNLPRYQDVEPYATYLERHHFDKKGVKMARRVCHYVPAVSELGEEGYVCDACHGMWEGMSEDDIPFAIVGELPEWMRACPVCGLKITKVGGESR